MVPETWPGSVLLCSLASALGHTAGAMDVSARVTTRVSLKEQFVLFEQLYPSHYPLYSEREWQLLCIALMEIWDLVWVPTPSEASVPYGDALRPAPDKLSVLRVDMAPKRAAFLNRVRFYVGSGCYDARVHLTDISFAGPKHPGVINAAHGVIVPYQEPQVPPRNHSREQGAFAHRVVGGVDERIQATRGHSTGAPDRIVVLGRFASGGSDQSLPFAVYHPFGQCEQGSFGLHAHHLQHLRSPCNRSLRRSASGRPCRGDGDLFMSHKVSTLAAGVALPQARRQTNPDPRAAIMALTYQELDNEFIAMGTVTAKRSADGVRRLGRNKSEDICLPPCHLRPRGRKNLGPPRAI
jgi:hypothetical protein